MLVESRLVSNVAVVQPSVLPGPQDCHHRHQACAAIRSLCLSYPWARLLREHSEAQREGPVPVERHESSNDVWPSAFWQPVPQRETDSVSSTFCVLPWVHLHATIEGVWSRCCHDRSGHYYHIHYQPTQPDLSLGKDALGCAPHSLFADANPERVMGLVDASNSQSMRTTRLQMLRGERPEACTDCFALEDSGVQSQRQRGLLFMGSQRCEALAASTDKRGAIPSRPVHLDLRLGNHCNMRCIMCGPPSSSSWSSARPGWVNRIVDSYSADEMFWDDLHELAPELESVYLAGGEPFIQPAHRRLLDLLIAKGVAGRIGMRYNSNISVLPLKDLERLRLFRHVHVGASCDAFGKDYERIRIGANWGVFVANLRELASRFQVTIDVTVQRYTMPSLSDLIEFALDEGVPIWLQNFVVTPRRFSLLSLDEEERTRLVKELTALRERLSREALAGNDRRSEQIALIEIQLERLSHFLGGASKPSARG